ncbi:Pullulanase, type I, partial [human gut metagenome]
SELPDEQKAIKANCKDFGTSQIGMFSDDLRDGLKGHVFTENAPGFINGQEGFEDTIKFGIVSISYT